MNYQKDIIKQLLKKYDKSKVSIGANKVNRKITISLSKSYIKYLEPTEYDIRNNINNAVQELSNLGLIIAKKLRNNTYDLIILVLDEKAIEKSYRFIGEDTKNNVRSRLNDILNKCIISDDCILRKYATIQLEKMRDNKSVDFFNEDFTEFTNVLKGVYEIQRLSEETFYRTFSIKVYNNSKYFEKYVKTKIEKLLFDYGDFEDKEKILEELNLVKTPSMINIKGDVEIFFKNGTKICVKHLLGGLGLSTVDIKKIDSILVSDNCILTVENLTNYYTWNKDNFCVVYLGGFSNHTRRNFLKLIYKNNTNKQFWHFGDIDAGGFYILKHLIENTNILFKPYCMDVETLQKNKKFWDELTQNDSIRLKKLLDSPYKTTIEFMLKNNCKLEQESITDI